MSLIVTILLAGCGKEEALAKEDSSAEEEHPLMIQVKLKRKNQSLKQKQLLYMLISEITIDRRREIESIHIKLTDAFIQLLQDTEGTFIEGVPSNYMLSKLGI